MYATHNISVTISKSFCILLDANTATCTILGPPPTKKLRVSTVTDDYDYPESATVKGII